MTEKRFFLDGNEIVTWIKDKETWEKLKTDQQVIDKLNALHEEVETCNEYCKALETDIVYCADRRIQLQKENEQLKTENKKLNERIGILEGSLIDKGFDINE